MIFLNVGHRISVRKCEYFGNMGDAVFHEDRLSLFTVGGRGRRATSLQSCLLQACVPAMILSFVVC